MRDGSHMEGDNLKPNVVYVSGEHEYFYKTNEYGYIDAVQGELHMKNHDGRLRHNSNTIDKEPGDHAGHLIADMFGGSPELDNLVSQAKELNLEGYANLERLWRNALLAGEQVVAYIDVLYSENSGRPTGFVVKYAIEGSTETVRLNNGAEWGNIDDG